jgi:hypothetical protein
MARSIKEWFQSRRIKLAGRFQKIREINRKYAKPRIKMTKAVKFALLMLRLYLLFLVGLLFYKFITLVH